MLPRVFDDATVDDYAVEALPASLPTPSLTRANGLCFEPPCSLVGRESSVALGASRRSIGTKPTTADARRELLLDPGRHLVVKGNGDGKGPLRAVEECCAPARLAISVTGAVEPVVDEVVIERRAAVFAGSLTVSTSHDRAV